MSQSRAALIFAFAAVLALPLGCSGGCKRFLYEGFGRDSWQQPERVVAELYHDFCTRGSR